MKTVKLYLDMLKLFKIISFTLECKEKLVCPMKSSYIEKGKTVYHKVNIHISFTKTLLAM
jgi:hypothetical protein